MTDIDIDIIKLNKPQVGCGAAIRNENAQILLIHRLTEPEKDTCGLPGGKIDFGETAQAAAMREINEELGIEINLTNLACISEIINQGDGAHWVSPVYEAHIISGRPQIKEPHKHGGWDWFSVNDMPDKITKPTQDYLFSLRDKRVE